MIVIRARNVQRAIPMALDRLAACGVRRNSRNGSVTMFPEPVTTVYERPTERVIFWKDRDANPFFHLMESLWMLAGRNDVSFLSQFVGSIKRFSDDGKTFHGAYGYRWSNYFHFDQLDSIITSLSKNKNDRRQVLAMWDAPSDLGSTSVDVPCNLNAIFQITDQGKLDMMVSNRSNDLVWGAYGANAVHFSILQEYVASSVGVPVGAYRQVSGNLHVYDETAPLVEKLRGVLDPYAGEHQWVDLDPYIREVKPFPLMTLRGNERWMNDLMMFMDHPTRGAFADPFFAHVAVPMYRAHAAYRNKDDPSRFETAYNELINCYASDWALAGLEWIHRRQLKTERRAKANDDGVLYEIK